MQLNKEENKNGKNNSFNTASGMDCMQCKRNQRLPFGRLFQYRKRYGLHAIPNVKTTQSGNEVSIPQAVWIACNDFAEASEHKLSAFQYRKRYGLHAIPQRKYFYLPRLRFNTASGMDCMQLKKDLQEVEEMEFQYRKRYGLHAICSEAPHPLWDGCFNTASGMDCMQFVWLILFERGN